MGSRSSESNRSRNHASGRAGVGAEPGEQACIQIPDGADVQLHRPTPRRVEPAGEQHDEGAEFLSLLRRSIGSGAHFGKDGAQLRFRRVGGEGRFQPVVGEPAAGGVERVVAFREGPDKCIQIPDVSVGERAEPVAPGVECSGVVDAEGQVRAECRQHARGQAGHSGPAMPDQVVRRVVRGADDLDIHFFQDAACGERAVRELFAGLVPDAFGGGLVEQFSDAEVAAQFQVGPHIKRVAQRVRHGAGPGLEFLEIARVLAGDEFFRNAVGAHGAPLVVVALQPDLCEVVEPAVLRDVLRRKVIVVVDDRLSRGHAVVQVAGDRRGEQEIVGEESHRENVAGGRLIPTCNQRYNNHPEIQGKQVMDLRPA